MSTAPGTTPPPATVLRRVRHLALGIVGLLALLLLTVLIPSSLRTDSRQAVITAEIVPILAAGEGPVAGRPRGEPLGTVGRAEVVTQLRRVEDALDALNREQARAQRDATEQQQAQLRLVLPRLQQTREELQRLEAQLAAHVIRADEVDGVRSLLFALRQDSARFSLPSRVSSRVGEQLAYTQQRDALRAQLARLDGGDSLRRGSTSAPRRLSEDVLVLRPRVPDGTWVRDGERIADGVRCRDAQVAAIFPGHRYAELAAGRRMRIIREVDGRTFTGRLLRLEAPSRRHSDSEVWATTLPPIRSGDLYAFISLEQETAAQPSLLERSLSWFPLVPQRLAARTRTPAGPDPLAFCGLGLSVRVDLD